MANIIFSPKFICIFVFSDGAKCAMLSQAHSTVNISDLFDRIVFFFVFISFPLIFHLNDYVFGFSTNISHKF